MRKKAQADKAYEISCSATTHVKQFTELKASSCGSGSVDASCDMIWFHLFCKACSCFYLDTLFDAFFAIILWPLYNAFKLGPPLISGTNANPQKKTE